MSNIVKVEFVKFDSARVIGKMVVSAGIAEKVNPIHLLWKQCFEDGTFKELEGMGEQVVNPDYVGWMGEYNPATGKFVYIAGMLMKPDAQVPEGYEYRDLEACTMAVAWIKGAENDNYVQGANLTMNAIKDSGYLYDDSQAYMMEVYNIDRFAAAMNKGEKEVILDYYAPCRKEGKF